MKPTLAIFITVFSGSAFAQGTFQNLDFEAANVVGDQPTETVSVGNAFPGWQALLGATPAAGVSYDSFNAGSPGFSIVDDKNGFGFVPFQGNYSAFVQSFANGSGTVSASLTQTGFVPNGTESILLDANQLQGSSFVVTLGGEVVSMVALQTFANYTLYGGSISAWAGQDATLSITEEPPGNPEFSPSLLQLDNISFSTQTVPEPGPLALTGVGGLLLALYRRFAPKRK